MRRARWAAMLPPLFWAAGILYLGSRPHLGSGVDLPGGDKVAHVALFAGLGYLTARGRSLAAPATRPGLWLLLAGIVGAADELNQIRVPGRNADPLDVVADFAGILLGFGLFHWRQRDRHEPDS